MSHPRGKRGFALLDRRRLVRRRVGDALERLNDHGVLVGNRVGRRARGQDIGADRRVDRRGDVRVGRDGGVDRRGQVEREVQIDVEVEQ